ncbi:hypothetical protein L1987_66266 [Smallanthus sonchifolius]|uniref:Uncharacterized protein n=1 Tax=Smallanthus sonchifolius TaxID=185202 RepID=A0ACB9BWM8_9ASTR|nr:hypothetical protein L1987_66266 [Smallanthus sonchifolius]
MQGKTVTVMEDGMAFADLHGKEVVVRLVDFEALQNINKTLDDMGVGECKIGGLFGKILKRAQLQITDDDLSYEYVGVLVGDGRRVEEEVTVLWQKKKFKVWVLEDAGVWVPDFLCRDSDNSDGGSS